jgi:hypothetical protein
VARFSGSSGGGEGTVGPQGPAGADGSDGADALWSFEGEWVNGVDYAPGSVVQFEGSSYYHPDGQFSSYSPPENGWLLVSSKGEDGATGATGADANTANFEFNANTMSTDEDMTITVNGVPGKVNIGGYLGVDLQFANNPGAGLRFPDETIQTTAYVPGGDAPAEVSFTVNGGTLGTQPTFDGAPLFSGSYVKNGPQVHFQIQVDMDNILTFGTGQYFVELPFHAKYGYQFKNGCLHDISNGKQYAIGGHVYAGSNQVLLSYTDSNGRDAEFDYNSPMTLTTVDNFHLSGDYIISDVD